MDIEIRKIQYNMKTRSFIILMITILLVLPEACKKNIAHRAMILTGQNTTNWEESSPVLKKILEQTGLFSCDIVTSPQQGGDMSTFKPVFSEYDLVVLDYNGDPWPDDIKSAFVSYVSNGGGVVVYRSAANAFPDWKEYNEICGLGGWGDRSEKDGPYVYYMRDRLVRDSTAGDAGTTSGICSSVVKNRDSEHPIIKGLPVRWIHAADRLVGRLRGPALNMDILATAYCDSAFRGPVREEPVLMTITYGKGRIFHTTLGYPEEGGGQAMQCAGFITTFQRGAEWAATGTVTQPVPFDFPNNAGAVLRPDFKVQTLDDDLLNIGSYEIDKSTRYYTDLQAHIREASGDPEELFKLEKNMVDILKSPAATVESKKLILRELSWMGSEYSIATIKELAKLPELRDEAEFALERLKQQ
jgi:hypothetical protein